jgi:hypothetical protein
MEELASGPRLKDMAEPIVQLVESQPPGREVLAKLGRRRIAVGIPDPGRLPGLASTYFAFLARTAGKGSVIAHCHGLPVRSRSSLPSTIDRDLG